MKLGVNAFLWTANFDASHFPILSSLSQHGFDGFEIPVFHPDASAASALRKELERNHLECTVCGILPPGMNPISRDSSVRSRTISHLNDCIRFTADLGSTLLAGPLYSQVGSFTGERRTADEWKFAVECFQSLTVALDQNGIDLAIEPLNRFETYFLTTASDARLFCDAVQHPRVGVLLDTFHSNIEEKNVSEAIRLLGPRLKHIHASENDRGVPGTGHVNFPDILSTLHDIDYRGYLTIESFGFRIPELSSAVSIWRDLATSPETIAFEGAKYLRRLMEAR